MFSKKSCNRCGKKIHKEFDFCPHCGLFAKDQEQEQRNYGLLGKNDINNMANELKLPLGFNTLFKRLMKEMDKQFQQLDKEDVTEKDTTKRLSPDGNPMIKQGGISINISSGGGKPIIKVKSFGNMPPFSEIETRIKNQPKKTQIKKQEIPIIDEETAKRLSNLPREEAISKVRRLSGKVVYELDLPEVKSIKDIIINQLENSIEVKAIAAKKAYFKFLPVSLPLHKYQFSDGKLTLELGEEVV